MFLGGSSEIKEEMEEFVDLQEVGLVQVMNASNDNPAAALRWSLLVQDALRDRRNNNQIDEQPST